MNSPLIQLLVLAGIAVFLILRLKEAIKDIWKFILINTDSRIDY